MQPRNILAAGCAVALTLTTLLALNSHPSCAKPAREPQVFDLPAIQVTPSDQDLRAAAQPSLAVELSCANLLQLNTGLAMPYYSFGASLGRIGQ